MMSEATQAAARPSAANPPRRWWWLAFFAGWTIFRCPQDTLGIFEQEGSSYEWNVDLNGHRLDETRTSHVRVIKMLVINAQPVQQYNEEKTLRFPPETTPLQLDYEDFHPRPPRPGKNVVYMDGHATGFELPPPVLPQ